MARKTKAEKAREAYVHKLVGRALVGSVINVFDISKVSAKAEELVAAGGAEQAIAESLQAYVKSIRKEASI
jgi:hypothetical protein